MSRLARSKMSRHHPKIEHMSQVSVSRPSRSLGHTPMPYGRWPWRMTPTVSPWRFDSEPERNPWEPVVDALLPRGPVRVQAPPSRLLLALIMNVVTQRIPPYHVGWWAAPRWARCGPRRGRRPRSRGRAGDRDFREVEGEVRAIVGAVVEPNAKRQHVLPSCRVQWECERPPDDRTQDG